MIDIPAHIRILATIKRGSVYYFKEDNFVSTEPHFFVVLNKNPKNNTVLILACATSQIEKRKEIARKLKFLEETLVEVSPSDFSFFTKSTLFDCNNVIEKSVQSLIDKLCNNCLEICSINMPENVVNSLIKGVLASSQVSEKNKKIMES